MKILKLICCQSPLFNKVYDRILNELVWNGFIRLILEEYLVLALAVMIKLKQLDFSTKFESVSSIYAICVGAAIIAFPPAVQIFLASKI